MTPALRARVLHEWQPLAKWEKPAPTTPALHQLVPGVMKHLGLEKRLHQSQVFHQWAEIVGSDIARHAQPVSLQNGILRVSIDHPVWHHALLPNKPILLQKIRERIGRTAVREIIFRIA